MIGLMLLLLLLAVSLGALVAAIIAFVQRHPRTGIAWLVLWAAAGLAFDALLAGVVFG